MATQIVIANGDNILLDNNFQINWNEKGNYDFAEHIIKEFKIVGSLNISSYI